MILHSPKQKNHVVMIAACQGFSNDNERKDKWHISQNSHLHSPKQKNATIMPNLQTFYLHQYESDKSRER